jgi:CDP-4-dehydro-6-deoxyglucose reductase, E1
MVNLVEDTIDKKDIDNLIRWLSTYPRLTKGPITEQLEEKWSKEIGVKYSVFCNSGSSANLLMLHTLMEMGSMSRGDTVVVPGLAWATDLSPVMQLGLNPVICDVNMEDLSVDLNDLEGIFKTNAPKALMLVSVLGLVPDMTSVVSLCDKYGVILLEDTCESMASRHRNQKLGSFGLMSSFSTYFGHHISTIEGGFVCTDEFEIYEILKAVRSHGWSRDLSEETKNILKKEWLTSDFESLYTFYYSGLNLRSTDLQAFIGIAQIDKLEPTSKIRNKNFNIYNSRIKNTHWSPLLRDHDFVSNFAYPIIHPNRDEIVTKLVENNIEVRPLICGSMVKQPFYRKKHEHRQLDNCSIIDDMGLYIPNHPKMVEEEIIEISQIINRCL